MRSQEVTSPITTVPPKWNLPAWVWWRLAEPPCAPGGEGARDDPAVRRSRTWGSRTWAGISTVFIALEVVGFGIWTGSDNGFGILLSFFAPFLGVVAGIVAVVIAHNRDEPKLWPWISLAFNLVPAVLWVLVVIAIGQSGM